MNKKEFNLNIHSLILYIHNFEYTYVTQISLI